jgi:hypothetical protein
MVRVRAKNAARRLTFLKLMFRFPIARHKKKITIIMPVKTETFFAEFGNYDTIFSSGFPLQNRKRRPDLQE